MGSSQGVPKGFPRECNQDISLAAVYPGRRSNHFVFVVDPKLFNGKALIFHLFFDPVLQIGCFLHGAEFIRAPASIGSRAPEDVHSHAQTAAGRSGDGPGRT
jgi:hypothetical protein